MYIMYCSASVRVHHGHRAKYALRVHEEQHVHKPDRVELCGPEKVNQHLLRTQ